MIKYTLLVAVLLYPLQLNAEENNYTTQFRYTVAHQPSGKIWKTDNSTTSENVPMPASITWSCEKTKATIRQDGNVVAGFSCISSGSATAQFTAICSPNKEDSSYSTGSISNLGQSAFIELMVVCKTRRKEDK